MSGGQDAAQTTERVTLQLQGTLNQFNDAMDRGGKELVVSAIKIAIKRDVPDKESHFIVSHHSTHIDTWRKGDRVYIGGELVELMYEQLSDEA